MARGRITEDLSTLEMALAGYHIEKQRIEDKIREIEANLKGKTGSSRAYARPKPTGVKRSLSAAARKRISAAQKRRWAEHRKQVAQAGREG